MKRYLVIAFVLTSTIYAHEKDECQFRDYENAPTRVKKFYNDQHKYQTYAFVTKQIQEFDSIMDLALNANAEEELVDLERQGKIKRMSIWDALQELDKLVDESDPDLNLPNSVHAFQTAEAIRKSITDESQDWFVLVGLLHDIGKVDALLRDTPQWAVVGDTFPVGCRFDEANIYAHYFAENLDNLNPVYKQKFGIYTPNIGLDNLVMSWGHDEYGYKVLSKQGLLPKSALSMIRFHSFYPLHQKGSYSFLLNHEQDIEQLYWIKAFNPYDLYSKSTEVLNVAELSEYYKKLINKYFVPSNSQTAKQLIWPVLRPNQLNMIGS